MSADPPARNFSNSPVWQRDDRFLKLRSRWLTLLGEHWRDEHGRTLEYWRIEKADSVIVLPLHNEQLVLPPPAFRPGVGEATIDFPGGRVEEGQSPHEAAYRILERELGLSINAIADLHPLNATGWIVNSSFSNQRLYGFVAQLHLIPQFVEGWAGTTYPTTPAGIQQLLETLVCLQCRSVLLEWWVRGSEAWAPSNEARASEQSSVETPLR